jgi:hypothetical protein
MSSGSVFFVLDRLIQSGAAGDMAVIAFGPGLMVDRIDLAAIRANSNGSQAPQRVATQWENPAVALRK